jgi:hypothetical protein
MPAARRINGGTGEQARELPFVFVEKPHRPWCSVGTPFAHAAAERGPSKFASWMPRHPERAIGEAWSHTVSTRFTRLT